MGKWDVHDTREEDNPCVNNSCVKYITLCGKRKKTLEGASRNPRVLGVVSEVYRLQREAVDREGSDHATLEDACHNHRESHKGREGEGRIQVEQDSHHDNSLGDLRSEEAEEEAEDLYSHADNRLRHERHEVDLRQKTLDIPSAESKGEHPWACNHGLCLGEDTHTRSECLWREADGALGNLPGRVDNPLEAEAGSL